MYIHNDVLYHRSYTHNKGVIYIYLSFVFKQLVYRHLCLDQNLASTYLANTNTQYNQQQNMAPSAQGSMMCQNALGQQLTVTKDECKYTFFSHLLLFDSFSYQCITKPYVKKCVLEF